MEEHPTYQSGPEPDAEPELDPGPMTDELVAMARAHHPGEAYLLPVERRRRSLTSHPFGSPATAHIALVKHG